MKNIVLCLIIVLGFGQCQPIKNGKSHQVTKYQTLDYVKVGQMFDTIRTPYLIDLSKGRKRIVFIGCSHTRDSTDRQYTVIEQYFKELQPQIAFNEGGQIPDNLHFRSKSEAIAQSGEAGFLKFICDQAKIKMLNGDITDSLEFSITRQKHPKDELFLYYVMERLVIPYLNRAYGDKPFEELYNRAITTWFVQPGFPLNKQEQSFAYFKQLYQKHIGRAFVLEINEDNFEKFDYINGGDCKFCAIGRTSKMVRDSVLLNKIDQALYQYDKIIVTFGHGHALAVEPALKQLIIKER